MAASHWSWGTACSAGNIVTLVRKDGLRIPLHRDVAPLVSMLMDLTEGMGYNIVPGWTWGQACRYISGTTTWSNHAKGTAVDLNAPMNPYASAAWHRRNANSHPFGLPRHTNIPEKVFRLWEDHGFTLGVKYGGKPDPMHVEFLGSVTQARAVTARLKAYLGHPTAALPKPVPPTTGAPVYRIYWFKQGGGPTEAHRCLCGKAEKGEWIIWSTHWISSEAELDAWRQKDLTEANTGSNPTVPRAYYEIHGGAYDNTKVA